MGGVDVAQTAWTSEVRRRLEGQVPAEPIEGDWPAVQQESAAAWDADRSELTAAHAKLLSAARALPAER